MEKLLAFISSFRINSISHLQYRNKELKLSVFWFLASVLFAEGIWVHWTLFIAAFLVFYILMLAEDYKGGKWEARIHYSSAVLFFMLLVYQGGLWTLPVPLVAAGYLYLKHKDKDIHFLVLEVLLFITTQIGILTS